MAQHVVARAVARDFIDQCEVVQVQKQQHARLRRIEARVHHGHIA
jgi:hypothetical protein